MSEKLEKTARSAVKRLPKRGDYDRRTIYSILDEGIVCHVGFVADGQPFVIPTAYGRVGDKLVIHGSAASRMMRNLREGIEVCVTVTLIDGLVLARSAFHHSVNYRSVVIFGRAELIDDEVAKNEALRAFTEHIVPGRWNDVRPPDSNELKATTVLSLALNEASAKLRTGDPVDDEADHDLDVWAGVVPLDLTAGAPVNDALLRGGIEVPESLATYSRKK